MTGARGPKSKPDAIRRNAPKPTKNMEAPTPAAPSFDLSEYRPQTVAWWTAWVTSPQVSFFAATDWQTLLRLLPLVDLYYGAPTAQLASEIRQTEAKLGATASDRDRLGWKIEPPAPEASDAKPQGSRARKDPRLEASDAH